MRNFEIASKCSKTAGQILVDVAEQTAKQAKLTYFKVSEKDGFDSLLLFSIHAKVDKDVVYLNSDLGFFVQKSFKKAKRFT